MSQPFFSIVIPTYNRSNLVKITIDSVISQSFEDYEIIVVDDGSEDDTAAVIQSYGKRVKYYYQKNSGVSVARNHGSKMALGIYLIFLDSDDILAKDSLLSFYNCAKAERPKILYAQAVFRYRDGSSKLLSPRDPYGLGKITNEGVHLSGAFAVNVELFKEINGYDEALKYGENTELFWRLLQRKPSIGIIDTISVEIKRDDTIRGSISPTNIVNSIYHVLRKHVEYLRFNKNTHWFYLNNLAIALLRLNRKQEAMRCLRRAIVLYPFRWKSYVRMGLAMINYYYKFR